MKILDLVKKKNSVYVVMLVLLLTKILGFLKLRTIAQLFGATHELDIFWAAFTIPDTLFMVILAGSLNAAIIPIFSDLFYKDGEEKLHTFFNRLLLVLGFIITAIALILFVFTPQITSFLIHSEFLQSILNFSDRIQEQDFSLFVDLTRVMMLSPILLGISTIITGYLQVRRQFFITSLAPLLYNLAMILGPIIFVVFLEMGVMGIAISAVVGSLLHFIIQIPTFKTYFTEKLKVNLQTLIEGFKDKYMWKGLKLAFPRTLAIFGEQVNIIVNTLISFTLTAGALSAYKFAFSLHLFPVNIIGSAVAQVALPELAEKSEDELEYKKLFNRSIQQALYLVLPIVSILLILRLPIVRLAYGTGQFDWNDTLITAWCLLLLSMSVIGQTLSQIILRGFYAIKETWLPLFAVGIGIVINIFLAFKFTNFFSHYYDWRPILEQMAIQVSSANGEGVHSVLVSFFRDFAEWTSTRGTSNMAVGGLSLSLSIASTIEVIILFLLLNTKIKILSWKETISPIIFKFVNAGLMAFGMYLVFRLFDFKLDTTRTWSIIVLTTCTTLYGILSYWLGSKVFDIKEVAYFEGKFQNIWNKFFTKI